ncbi:MAG: DUF362 domain-containing protein [Pirellulales bacterium]
MGQVSVVVDSQLRYPAESPFSPSERYPEYRFEHLSPRPNLVYEAVRKCFAQAGLDAGRFGTADWNPLGQWIKPGQRVFVLCNFVYHRRANESTGSFSSKCTDGSVLRALLDYVLLAVGSNGTVRFGNAPVQGCLWDAVLEDTRAQEVAEFFHSVSAPVEPCDLRLFIAERSPLGGVRHVERRDEGDAVSIDLADKSLLAAEGQRGSSHFRLSDYDPRRTEAAHSGGRHVYVVHRQALEADVIVSIPKLKTHEKVGITCALKGCVGVIGHKDCLAHHRFGSPEIGGDEYPRDRFRLLRMVSRFHDWVYKSAPGGFRGNVLRVMDRICRSGVRRLVPVIGGAWWGNDTAWRMALDIARIVRYADRQGVMQTEPVRPHLALMDGVVGGEGAGPLKPAPVPSGVILFGDDAPLVDYACARLMGFDPTRIPLVSKAFDQAEYALTRQRFGEGDCILNGKPLPISDLHAAGERRFDPPPGWRDFVELMNGSNTNGERVAAGTDVVKRP